jgi:hypothetical protein
MQKGFEMLHEFLKKVIDLHPKMQKKDCPCGTAFLSMSIRITYQPR